MRNIIVNLTTVALPNLIANDLVIVHPMASLSGYITYVKYTAGSNKGATRQGDVFNSPFKLGNVDANYTAASVAESHTATAAEVAAHVFTVKWTPVASVSAVKIGSTAYSVLTTGSPVADTSVLMGTDGTITFAAADTLFVANAVVDVLYVYDNVIIPQNDLPIVNAEIASIALVAKARRVAVNAYAA